MSNSSHTSTFSKSESVPNESSTTASASDFKCAPIFQHLENLLKEEGKIYVDRLKCVYGFQVGNRAASVFVMINE